VLPRNLCTKLDVWSIKHLLQSNKAINACRQYIRNKVESFEVRRTISNSDFIEQFANFISGVQKLYLPPSNTGQEHPSFSPFSSNSILQFPSLHATIYQKLRDLIHIPGQGQEPQLAVLALKLVIVFLLFNWWHAPTLGPSPRPLYVGCTNGVTGGC